MTDIESIITRLLHIEEENSNKLIDLGAREGMTFVLNKENYAGELAELMFDVVRDRIGKTATTVLEDSALSRDGKFAAPGFNVFAWEEPGAVKDPERLDRFYKDALRLTTAKGDNPVFLSIGALKWRIPEKKNFREILSPLILVPVRLVRSGGALQPITVEFADDDIFFNPSFYEKLKSTANARFAEKFPLPAADLKTPVDLDKFKIKNYFAKLEEYLRSSVSVGEENPYELVKNLVAVSMYNNPDMSTYRDIERNKQKILSHPVVRAMFFKEDYGLKKPSAPSAEPPFVLPYDGRQFRILQRVLAGENLVVKGPPGTGKTQTIANLIAALLADGKRVLFSSKKISALAEVYNKLPEELKPFLLRLDYESEADTAKIDAKEVHNSLKEARAYRSKEKECGILARRAEAYDRKYGAITRLNGYKKKMFEEGVSGDDFYTSLVGYMKGMQSEPVPFELPGKVLQTSKEDYLAALETVKRAAACWEKLTDGNRIPIRLNPWYSVKAEASIKEKTFETAEELRLAGALALQKLDELDARSPDTAATVRNFRLDVVKTIAECPLTPDDAEAILLKGDLYELSDKLKRFSVDVRVGAERISAAKKKGTKIFEIDLKLLKPLSDVKTASNLDLRLLKRVSEKTEIYNDKNGVLSDHIDLPLLLNALRMYGTSLSEAKNTAKSVASVFDESVFTKKEENKALTDAYDVLKKYIGTGENAPKAFDFAAKKALKIARKSMRTPDYTDFAATLNALQRVQNYNRYANQAAKFMEKARNLLHYCLSDDDATDLLRLLEAFYTEGNGGFQEEIRRIVEEIPVIESARRASGVADDCEMTLGELKELYRAAQLRKKLDAEFASLKKRAACLSESSDFGYYELMGNAVEALGYLSEAEQAEFGAEDRTPKEHALATIRLGLAVKKIASESDIVEFMKKLTEFYQKSFSDSAYANLEEIRLCDLRDFVKLAEDRSYLAAATNYRLALQSEKRLNVTAFFRPFRQGERKLEKGETFPQLFEHSFYAIRIDAVKATLGESVYALTRDNLEADRKTLSEAEKELYGLNAARTSFLCASRFDPEDRLFDFLKTNTSYTSCRRLFQEKADEIVRLKQCFILSPSSVGLLLRADEYWNFDVAVIDEASQMPPEYVLGIAARAKQCVVVGDENQMPPIKHFVRTTESGTEDGLVAVESALELLKQNGTFPVEELSGHYRSMTETLIRYSQKRFYPEMVTFPSVLPRGESLGLFDVFVDGAVSYGGENPKEAAEVVRAVRRHFERFYDEKKHSLSRSVGIVTFGTKQRELVLKKLAEDRELFQKIRLAEDSAEVPEKVFFVRTIETVQGQETDCLILSVTYGRDKNGKTNENFGQLNGKLGERIFNVAVTRAKYSVTLIHSIRPSEISAEGILYLKKYMEEVERFDADEAGKQFLSGGKPDAFRTSVKDALIKAGISEDRIVFDYGVTENSVKIPIAVLSEDQTRADFGVWLETEPFPDYLDGIVRYPEILRSRGWALYEIFAFDWIRNYEAERKKLIAFAKKHSRTTKK